MQKLVALLLIALLGFAAVALAQGSESPAATEQHSGSENTETELPEASQEPWHHESEDETNDRRGLVVQIGANGAHIRSQSSTNRFYIDVNSVAGGDLQIRLKYASKNGKGDDDNGTDVEDGSKKRSGGADDHNGTVPSGTEDHSGNRGGEKVFRESVQFRVRLVGLDEFLNTDGTAGLGENDTVTSRALWSDGTTTFTTTYPTTNTFTATNVHPSGLIQRVIFKFDDQSFFDGNGTLLPATALKFDYEFENFTYTSADSYVALEVRLQGPPAGWDLKQAQTSAQKWAQLSVGTGGDAFFSWTPALTTPAGGSVVATRFARTSYSDDQGGWASARAYFTFLGPAGAHQPSVVVWDPSVVVASANVALLSITAMVIAAVALLL